MGLEKHYGHIIRKYPEYVSKEQMRIICHISKRKARYLLQSGIVPCENSGKLTRNYKIKTTDIVKYLQDRDKLPKKYKRKQPSSRPALTYGQLETLGIGINDMAEYYEELFKDYPDIVTVSEIAQMTGLSSSCILNWLKKNKIMSFKSKGAYRVPKSDLLQFLVSAEYRRLGIRTEKQYSDMEGLMIWYRENQAQQQTKKEAE